MAVEIPDFQDEEQFEKWWVYTTEFYPDSIPALSANAGIRFWLARSRIKKQIIGTKLKSLPHLRSHLDYLEKWIEKNIPDKKRQLKLKIADWLQSNTSLNGLIKQEGAKRVQETILLTVVNDEDSKLLFVHQRQKAPTTLEVVFSDTHDTLDIETGHISSDSLEQVLSRENPPTWATNLYESIIVIEGDTSGPLSEKFKRARQEAPLLGAVVSNYAITEVLGRGGMGIVYLGEEQNTGKTVAIKSVLPKSMLPGISFEAYQNFVKRFVREAKVIAGLSKANKHIVRIEIAGITEETPFYTMEYLPGAIPEEAMAIEEAVNTIFQAGCAFEAAHTIEFDYLDYNNIKQRVAGVAHRDIKPDNLRMASDGTVKVTDWDLASIEEGEVSRLTKTGTLMGTPVYMSPEQITGAKATTKTDVFSLGLVFYELLTGKLPWRLDQKSVEEIQGLHFKLLDYPPELLEQARPSHVKRDIPRTIDGLVFLMLQPDPAKRPNMTEVLDSLSTYRKGKECPFVANRLSLVAERIRKVKKERWWQRNKKKVVVAIAALGVIGTVLAFLVGRESPEVKRSREALAQYETTVQLYRDAQNDRVPESALAKFETFLKQVRGLREKYPDMAFELLEKRIDEAKLEAEKRGATIKQLATARNAQTTYASLVRTFEDAAKNEKEGNLSNAASGYSNFLTQLEALLKQYPDMPLDGAKERLSQAREKSRELTEKHLVMKYNSQLSIIQKNFILKEQYEDARISLVKLLAELRGGANQEQLSEIKDKITKRLDDVRIKLKDIGENKAFAPLKKNYEEIYALEKENKLIDAKTLYEKLIADCTKAGDFVLIKELLAKTKTRPEQLHKKILDYALKGDFAKLDQSHKEIVEYTIDSMKQRYGADPRKLTPARNLSAADLEERIKHHEIILKEMCRWKVMQTVKSMEAITNKVLFPRYAIGNTWGYNDILENPSVENCFYVDLLSLAYDITKNDVFAKEIKERKNSIGRIRYSKLISKGDVDYFPLFFHTFFDSDNEDDKKTALKLIEEFTSYITKEGLFRYPSGNEKWYIRKNETLFTGLIKAYNYSKNKDILEAMNRIMKTSIKYQYNPKDHIVYFCTVKKGRAIKPLHKTIYSDVQIYGMLTYLRWYDFVKHDNFKMAAEKIADNYMNWVKLHTNDLVPPDWMNQKEAENNKKNAENVKAVYAFFELAYKTKQPEKSRQYEDFAQQVMHSYIVGNYLNTSIDRQGVLLHCVIANNIVDVTTIDTDFGFLKSLQEIIDYEKKILELKRNQEEAKGQ